MQVTGRRNDFIAQVALVWLREEYCMELWAPAYSAPRGIVKSAKVAEAGGWIGLSVVNSRTFDWESVPWMR